MDIFLGNLAFLATEDDVKKLFSEFGSVSEVKIVMEKGGKKSRGFGFLTMPDDQQAQAAIAALDKTEFMGRPIEVSPRRPKPKKERPPKHPKTPGKTPAWVERALAKQGGYKGGRRTRSFLRRTAGTDESPVEHPRKRKGRTNAKNSHVQRKSAAPGRKARKGGRAGVRFQGGRKRSQRGKARRS